MSELPSHEFQVPIEAGEDTILACDDCLYGYNKEVWKETGVKEGDSCQKCDKGSLKQYEASEVGNIFRQGTKYSEPMKANFVDEDGKQKSVVMGGVWNWNL